MAQNKQDEPGSSSEFSPVGTWVLLCLIAAGMTAAWLFLYFGVFMSRGPLQ
jgi:hypothetical protein